MRPGSPRNLELLVTEKHVCCVYSCIQHLSLKYYHSNSLTFSNLFPVCGLANDYKMTKYKKGVYYIAKSRHILREARKGVKPLSVHCVSTVVA